MDRRLTRRARPLNLVLLVAAFAGCGGGDDTPARGGTAQAATTATTSPAPTPTPDPRPRVEGKWRLLFTPGDEDRDPSRVTWTITPRCAAGACSGRVLSSTGNRFRFTFDEALEDYTSTGTFTEDCVNTTSEELVVARAYRGRTRGSFSVVESVKNDEGVHATEMYGEFRSRTRLAGVAVGICEPDELEVDDIRAVRKDASDGEPVTSSIDEDQIEH